MASYPIQQNTSKFILFPLNTSFEKPVTSHATWLFSPCPNLSASVSFSISRPHKFRCSNYWKIIKTTLPVYKIFNHKSHNCQHQDTVNHVFHQTSLLPFSASILQEDILKTSSVIYGSKFYCHEKGTDASIRNKMQRNKIVRFSQLSLWRLQLSGPWHHSSETPVNLYQTIRYHRRQ
jgi:hypothetical protein